MLNQAAYSCTHYFLWTHLQIIKPQSLLRLGAQLKGCVKLLIPASRRGLFPLFYCIFFIDHCCQAKHLLWCHNDKVNTTLLAILAKFLINYN